MLRVKSPGRICLFGEHQDYLDLPVVSMAISLHSTIIGKKINSRKIIVHKQDLGEIESFSLDDLKYDDDRDYFKSGIVTCMKEGLEFSNGFEVEIESALRSECRRLPCRRWSGVCFAEQPVLGPIRRRARSKQTSSLCFASCSEPQ